MLGDLRVTVGRQAGPTIGWLDRHRLPVAVATLPARRLPGLRRPLCVVHGNCQAEPLRRHLAAHPGFRARYRSLPVPAVQDMTPADARLLGRLSAHAAVLVTQPVHAGYGGLPIGTDDVVRRLPTGATVVRFPSLYHLAPFPYQRYVTLDGGGHDDAPLTGYHDLRHLAVAARGMTVDEGVAWMAALTLSVEGVRATDAAGRAELAARDGDLDVVATDAITGRSFFTVNHPTDALLRVVAARVLTHLGLDPADARWRHPLRREPLGGVRTPIERAVLSALDGGGEPDTAWTIGGASLSYGEVLSAHLAHLAAHPEVLAAALDQHGAAMVALGLLDGGGA